MADISKITTPDGTDLNIKDATARSDVSNKVSKSGDTMSGTLFFNPSSSIQVKTNIDKDVIPTDDIAEVLYNFRDKNDNFIGVLQARQYKDVGNIATIIGATREVNGTNHFNHLTLSLTPSGGKVVQVSDKPSWRSALGLATVASSGNYNDLTNKPTIPDISTKVSKSGDTMTGDLILNNKNSVARDTDINPSSNPSSTIYGNGHYLQRSDGSNLGYVRACKSNAGTDFMQIEALRTISGTNYYNTINLNIASNGTKTVGVSDPSAWRSAIGINNNLATYISADGTNCISANNCNIQFIKCVRIGQIVTCTFHLAHSSAKTGGVAYVALKSDFRPSRQIFFPVSIVGNASAYANESAHRMYLYTDGTLKLNIDNTNATVQQVMGSVSYCIN